MPSTFHPLSYYSLLTVFKWTPSIDYLLTINKTHFRYNPDQSIECAWLVKACSKDALFSIKDAMSAELANLYGVPVYAVSGPERDINDDRNFLKSTIPFDCELINLKLPENASISYETPYQ